MFNRAKKSTDQAAFRDLVDRLVQEVNKKHLKFYNDLLIDIAQKHGWSIYWAVVHRLVEVQSSQFKKQYQADGSPYFVLGLTDDAPDEVVRFAYLFLARRLHPDHGGDGKLMVKVNNAMQSIMMERGWKVMALPGGEAG